MLGKSSVTGPLKYIRETDDLCIYSREKTTYSGVDLIKCLSKPSVLFKSIAGHRNVILHTSDL